MDSFFDSLRKKMSKRYNKGEQPQPAPRQVYYNTRKAEKEWRDRQVNLSREALEQALEHREAVLDELRGQASGKNSYGGARPKAVSMDPRDLFRGHNPVQEEAPPSLPAVDLNYFPGLERRNESGPILTKRQNYPVDKEVMLMGDREREASQNQNGTDYVGQVTIEDSPEDDDIVQPPPRDFATNTHPQGDGQAWALPTASNIGQPPVTTYTNDPTMLPPNDDSGSQYIDFLMDQPGYNFVSNKSNVQQRLLEVSGCVDQLARMMQYSGQEQQDTRAKMAAITSQLEIIEKVHTEKLNEIFNTIKQNNEQLAADRNTTLDGARRAAGLPNATNLVNEDRSNDNEELLPRPSAPPFEERSRTPYKTNYGDKSGGYNNTGGERNHSQRPTRMSSTGRGENQTSYHTVHDDTSHREPRESHNISGSYGAENVTNRARTGASVSFQPGVKSTPIFNPGAGAQNRSLGAPSSFSESYGARQRSYQSASTRGTHQQDGLFVGRPPGDDPGNGGSSSSESGDGAGDRRSNGHGGPGDGRGRGNGSNGGHRGNGDQNGSGSNNDRNSDQERSGNGGHRGSGGRGDPPYDPPGGGGGQGGSGGWQDSDPFFNGDSWNYLSPYYNEKFGPIYSDSYVGWALEIVQARHPEWEPELQQAMVKPVPENLWYKSKRDPLVEKMRHLKLTSEFTKAVINKKNLVTAIKLPQFNKDTTIYEDYFSEIAQVGRARCLEDQDLKEIIFRTMPTSFQQEVTRKGMEPDGKYAHFLRADRYAFTFMITLFPYNSKLTAQEEFEKCRQSQTQNLEEYLDLKRKFYRMGYTNFGEDNWERFYQSVVKGLRNKDIKKEMITYMASNQSKLQQPESYKDFKEKILKEASILQLQHSYGQIGAEGLIGAASATSENMQKHLELMHKEQRKEEQKKSVHALEQDLESDEGDSGDVDDKIDDLTVSVVEQRTGACFNCGEQGHYKRECKKPLQDVERMKQYWKRNNYSAPGASKQIGSSNGRPGAVSVMNSKGRRTSQSNSKAGSKTSSGFRSYFGSKKGDDSKKKFTPGKGFYAKKFTAKIGDKKVNMLQLDAEGTCVSIDEEDSDGAVQEISEELPEAAVEATAATEAAVEAEQVEDEQVVHSIAPAEPEEEWNFFF